MNAKKLLILSLLVIFVVGLSLSAVSASKTIKIKGYKVKLSNKDIKKIKKGDYVIKSTHKKLTDKGYNYEGKPYHITGTVKIGIQKWSKKKIMAYLFNDYPTNGYYRDITKKRIKL